MAKARLADRLKELIEQSLAGPLRQAGFSLVKLKDDPLIAANFVREGTDPSQVLAVQRDKSWTNIVGNFTLNVGVDWPAINQFLKRPVASPPSIGYCCLEERLGVLIDGKDKWWKLWRDTDIVAMGSSIAASMATHALPWLEKHSTLEGLRDGAISSYDHMVALAACELLGDRAATLKTIRDVLLKSPEPDHDLIAWGEHHGIFNASIASQLRDAMAQPAKELERALKALLTLEN